MQRERHGGHVAGLDVRAPLDAGAHPGLWQDLEPGIYLEMYRCMTLAAGLPRTVNIIMLGHLLLLPC